MRFRIVRASGAAEPANLHITDIKDNHIRGILPACKERTKQMEKVQQLHDDQRKARGLGNGQHASAPNIDPATRQRFTELADQWETETVFLSRIDLAIKHPAHQEIISMGEPVVPLILQRMRETGGHWDHTLADITGANPVKRSDWGNIAAIQASWLEWGEANGLA